MGELYNFYTNQTASKNGLFLKDIWKFTSWDLENREDYFDLLFPDDPKLIKQEDFLLCLGSRDFRENLLHSLSFFEEHLGLAVEHKFHHYPRHALFKRFDDQEWFTQYHQNYKKISQVLRALKTFHYHTEANELLDYILVEVCPLNRHLIGDENINQWKNIVENPIPMMMTRSA